MGSGPYFPILYHSPIPSHVGYPIGYPLSFRLVIIKEEYIYTFQKSLKRGYFIKYIIKSYT